MIPNYRRDILYGCGLALLLSGCRAADLDITPQAVQATPRIEWDNQAEPLSLAVYVTLQITNQSAKPQSIAPADFTLALGDRSVPADFALIDDEGNLAAQDNPLLAFNPFDLLHDGPTTTLEPGRAAVCQLRFRGVRPLARPTWPDHDNGRDLALRRRLLLDALADAPRLSHREQAIDLRSLTSLPRRLVPRPSAYDARVTVVDLPCGANGFVFADLEQWLAAAAFGPEALVVIHSLPPTDGCLAWFWPPATTISPERLEVCTDDPTTARRPRSVGPMSRPLRDDEMPHDEAHAVARLLKRAGQGQRVLSWLADDRPKARIAALHGLDQDLRAEDEAVLTVLAGDPSLEARRAACAVLWSSPLDASSPAYPQFRTALRDAAASADQELMILALGAAVRGGCPDAVLPVARRLLQQHAWVEAASDVVRAAGDRDGIPSLFEILLTPGGSVVADELAELLQSADLPRLRAAVRDHLTDCGGLQECLRRIGTAEDAAVLVSRWDEPYPDRVLKSRILTTFGILGGSEALNLLLAIGGDAQQDRLLREKALEALATFQDPRVVQVWEAAAPSFAVVCITRLKERDGPAARAALQRLTKADGEQCRNVAKNALRELGSAPEE